MDEKVLFMTTGGTIDGEWSPVEDTAVNNGEKSYLPSYVAGITGSDAFQHVFITNKDSRRIELGDNLRMVRELTTRGLKRALVTAGTYQMGMMEGFLRNNDGLAPMNLRLSLLLTGATIPLHGFTGSDAGFNLGATLCALRYESSGISGVCMNGSLIRNGEGGKDVSLSQFRAHHERHDVWKDLRRVDFVHTGGSIDFRLDGMDGLTPLDTSSIPHYMDRVNVRQDRNHYGLLVLKDGALLSSADIDETIDRVRHITAEKIIITIGTFGMQKVFDRLRQAKIPDKTIILTASRLPLAGIEKTDAPFQLGYSFALLNYLNPGVHASFNGKTGTPKDILPKELLTKRRR